MEGGDARQRLRRLRQGQESRRRGGPQRPQGGEAAKEDRRAEHGRRVLKKKLPQAWDRAAGSVR